LRLIQLTEIPDNDDLRRQWNALVGQALRPEVFYTWEWARAVQWAHGESRRPWLLLWEKEDRSLAAIAALATTGGTREAHFLTSTTADYCDFLSVAGFHDEMVEAVLAECRKNDQSLTLANLPAESATVAALRKSAKKFGYYLHERPAYRCAQVSLIGAGVREEMKAALHRKMRNSLERKMRRLMEAVEAKSAPQLDHLVSWEEVTDQLPEFARTHLARFRVAGRASNLADPNRRKFLEELARLLSAAGWLRLSRLQVGGRNVAWNYGFLFAGSWFWYQPTFDMALEQYSPGAYLLAKIVSAACDDPRVTGVDLGLGAEGYKERFANSSRDTLHVTVTRSLPGHLRGVIRYRAAESLKQFPLAEKAVRKVLRRPR
jgi:CelD/BcsL family acetyltransferase involved in cellulose biosynthesis